FENIVRFWTWVFGLSGEKHVSFANTVVSPPGYLQLFLTELPEIVLVGILLSFLLVVWKVLSGKIDVTTVLLVSVAGTVVAWLGMLSMSEKQTWRYALPVVPLMYLFAGGGCWLIMEKVFKKKQLIVAASSILVF